MKITIIGTGYVGLVTGVCLAEMGHHVRCLDIIQEKVDALSCGKSPIYERGLDALLVKNIEEQRISFTTNIKEALKGSKICFICVGTPPDQHGAPNLNALYAVAESLAKNLEKECIVAVKSTVPVGTCEKLNQKINNTLATQNKDFHIDVVSNPEFLKEGVAIDDFMRPDRIVVGANKQSSFKTMRTLYRDFIRNGHAFLPMSLNSSEMTKYAANAMLATRISFINEIANLCEHSGANIKDVRVGMGSDKRIGMKFLYPGIGYGGSCFPKDVQALIALGKENDCPTSLLSSTHLVNENQWLRFANLILSKVKAHAHPTVSVWGLSFKPNTDDIREAPAIKIIEHLLEQNVSVQAYDPIAMENTKALFESQTNLSFHKNAEDACGKSDALVITSEWGAFRNPNFTKLKEVMRHQQIFDGRNIFEPDEIHAEGFDYYWVGRHHG